MNRSIQYFYPEAVFDGNQKQLFNPVLRKRYKNRPEERVRLQWVDFLLQNNIWKKGRIGFEIPVNITSGSPNLRADLVLYNHAMQPEVLIECKADSVPLHRSAAEQAARYNKKLGAKCIILSNGISHQTFTFEQGTARPSEWPFRISAGSARNISYWQKRGFCSDSADALLKTWLEKQLAVFSPGGGNSAEVRYLTFAHSFLPFPMDHYYLIEAASETETIACTFAGYSASDTFAAFILKKNGGDNALAVVNLAGFFGDEPPKIRVISPRADQTKNISPAERTTFLESDAKLLPKFIRKFFD